VATESSTFPLRPISATVGPSLTDLALGKVSPCKAGQQFAETR